jgi:hypothetical protein
MRRWIRVAVATVLVVVCWFAAVGFAWVIGANPWLAIAGLFAATYVATYLRRIGEAVTWPGGYVPFLPPASVVFTRAAWKACAKRLRAELKATNAWNVRLLDQAQQERDVYERSLSEAARELKSRGERIAELERAPGNLLAVIHRDGGHYVLEHGKQKATKDAMVIVCGLRAKIDELTSEHDARIDLAAALAREASCKC